MYSTQPCRSFSRRCKVVITLNGTELLRGFDIYNSDHTEVLAEFHDPRTVNVCLGTWSQTDPHTFKLLHPGFGGITR